MKHVKDKILNLHELTKPKPFSKEEILGCLLSHRIFASSQVKTNSSFGKSSMSMKRKQVENDAKKTKKKKKPSKKSASRWSKKPLRLMLDNGTVSDMIDRDASIIFNQEYRKKGMSKLRYEKYKVARTCKEALKLGAKRGDLKWDLSKGIARAVQDDFQTLICKNLKAKRDEKIKMGISKFEPCAVEKSAVTASENFVTKNTSIVDSLFSKATHANSSAKSHVRKTARKSTISTCTSFPISTGVTNVVPPSTTSPPIKKPRINNDVGGAAGSSRHILHTNNNI